MSREIRGPYDACPSISIERYAMSQTWWRNIIFHTNIDLSADRQSHCTLFTQNKHNINFMPKTRLGHLFYSTLTNCSLLNNDQGENLVYNCNFSRRFHLSCTISTQEIHHITWLCQPNVWAGFCIHKG